MRVQMIDLANMLSQNRTMVFRFGAIPAVNACLVNSSATCVPQLQ